MNKLVGQQRKPMNCVINTIRGMPLLEQQQVRSYRTTTTLQKRKFSEEERLYKRVPQWLKRQGKYKYKALYRDFIRASKNSKAPRLFSIKDEKAIKRRTQKPTVGVTTRIMAQMAIEEYSVESTASYLFFANIRKQSEFNNLPYQMLYLNRNAELDGAFIKHLQDPIYWTPQRLTHAYSFNDRNVIAGELLIREFYIYKQSMNGHPIDPLFEKHLEKYNTKQFNFDKVKVLFKEFNTMMKRHRHQTRVQLPQYFRTRSTSSKIGIVTESEALEGLINKSRKLVAYGGHDDELPSNVKIPFSENKKTSTNRAAELAIKHQSKFIPFNQYDFHRPEAPIEEVATVTTNNLKPRQKLIITEMGRQINNSNRRVYSRETDGVVRTASQNELDMVTNVGSYKKTKNSFGGSSGGRRVRRRRLLRARLIRQHV